VAAGDPAFDEPYQADLVNLFEILHSTGAPVIGLIPPCYGPNTNPGAEPPPVERQDVGRIRAVRHDWDLAAARTGETIAPLDDELCPGGTADSEIRRDGAHYDGAGADLIAPSVMKVVRRQVARSVAAAQSSDRTPRSPNQASSATHPAS
jgi:hypothetical protein